ncbi:hypothetical protein [Burkholderia ubonensis]|uniref:SpaN/EivJ family type III secretion system needle length determinant n=1 Tax=Burkholderia ubonensis TaxID=101571 RepID=UPI000A50F8F2|nr:hypothetical protein [Burkholderia ubonensis]
MASINIRNAHHFAKFGEPGGADRAANDTTSEVKDVSYIEASEDEYCERPSALVKAYCAAVIEVTKNAWLELDEGEALPVDHEKDRRRKRNRTGSGEAAIWVPSVPLDPISDLDGPILEPVMGVKDASGAGTEGAGFRDSVDAAQSEDRGPAERIALRGDTLARDAGRSTGEEKEPEGVRVPASGGGRNRQPGSRSVVELRVEEMTREPRSDHAPAVTEQDTKDAEDIRARNRAARSPGHSSDATHRHSADGAESTEDAGAPERREHRQDPAPVAARPPVDAALSGAGAGTVVNYRFKSWGGQPTVRLRLETRRGDAALDVSTDDRRAEAAMREHAGGLSLDVPLRFDRDVVDDQDSNASGQQRESDES